MKVFWSRHLEILSSI